VVILAAGLTPAWQQILTFSTFRPGEVNRAQSVTWCASGKVLNVGSALHHLGVASQTVSYCGGGTGRLMRDEFEQLGIPTRWVESAVPTRVCTTILDETTRTTTELVENSQPVRGDELDQYAATFAQEALSANWVILSGSLPQQTPADFYRRLMDSTPAHVLIDARGEELTACLPRKPFLVKPNREELSKTLHQPILTDHDLASAMRQLQQQGAQRVLVSHGAGEVWLLTPSGLLRFQPPRVPTVNPIGCGDCLAAGLAVAYSEGRSDADAVRFGIAAAAENVQHLLPARLERTRIEQLANRITVRE
jgi:1-phosphofructokinase family hexose kinase